MKRRPRREIMPLLARVREKLAEIYGDRRVSVILYGSFTCGRPMGGIY